MKEHKKIEVYIHDIRNPLIGMLDALEHLNDMFKNGEDLTTVTRILDQTCRDISNNWENLKLYINNEGKEK
jgi:hypothetical protein